MIEHALRDIVKRDGWDVAVCGCWWEGPPCPDAVTAANFWGQHLLAVAESKHKRVPDTGEDTKDRERGF